MWRKIIIPMYMLWLHSLYGLYGPRCPLYPKRPINLTSLSLSAAGWTKTWYYRVFSEYFSQSDQKNYLLWYILFKNTCAYSFISVMIDWVYHINTYHSDKISEHRDILVSQWVRILKLWIFHLSYRWVKVIIISLLTYTLLKMIFFIKFSALEYVG